MFQFGHSIMMEDCWNWLNCDKLTCCAVSAQQYTPCEPCVGTVKYANRWRYAANTEVQFKRVSFSHKKGIFSKRQKVTTGMVNN